ncbi:DUF4254 domain-containing protein [Nocardia pneumoniae]|uniref:DUF4254 domain-containing protein n=1 Tax=Nocardia pneumoniae TaxID=228601 RepID=UPI0002DDE8C0|nr:DUF4254 domain-containing protein [Nocardia pneumoniae]
MVAVPAATVLATVPVMTVPGLSFPSDDELLLSMRGRPVGDHPLSPAASEFAQLYEQLREHPDRMYEISCRRDELILEIDVWVAQRLPVPHPDATLHTETLGAVIDRLAESQVHAYELLMTVDPADPRVHAAWYRLAELADGYTDLTTGILHRARRLPALGDHR